MSLASAWLWLWLAGAPSERSSEPQAIHGGAPADVCEFPTAVALYENGVLCSGTLVHPRLVLTAAHCIGGGPGPSVITFGEDILAPTRTVAVDHCLANPAATGNLGPWDFAYCLLAEDVLDIPPTPVLLGCETERLVYGQAVTIVGFGADDGDDSGRKHVGETIVSSQTAGDVVLIGADGAAACSGDSGGPAYVQLGDGSWRAFGIVSGGVDCEANVTYVTMHSMIGWVEQQTGMDFTPCHDADGSWNPGPACREFSLEAHAPAPGTAWPSCDGARSGPASSCGPAFGSEDDVEAPIVSFVEPLDGQVFAGVPSEIGVVIDAIDSGAGVEHVELWIGGQQVADDDAAPWMFDGASFPAGEWMVEARALDWRGNVGAATITIWVGDAPDETGDSDTGDASTGETETGTPIDTDAPGCSCGTTGRPVGVAPWCLLWSIVWLGRRR